MGRRFAAPLLIAVAAIGVWAQTLLVSQANAEVRIAAPDFHFLAGRPLERLRNGNAVAFDFQLLALAQGRTDVIARAFERFIVSYDLWEQTYSVARMRGRRTQAAHMTAPQAELWCIEAVTLPVSALPKGEAVVFRLEVRAQDAKTRDPAFDEAGLSLAQLVDIFSRATGARAGNQWKVESAPVRLRGTR